MRFFRTAVTSVVLCGAIAPAVRAQDVYDTPPPHIAFVDGGATLDREDLSEPAVPDMPLVPGDRVRTDRGRVEVLFPDGSALDVDEYSSFEFQAPGLLRVTSGRVLLIVAGASDPASAGRFQIDTPIASAQTYGPGEYRVSILSSASGIQTELAVVRGSGTLVTEFGSMPLRAGERSVAWDNAAPASPQFFNSARFDAFDRWAAARRDERMGSRSAQYLPSDLRTYGGTLDRYGSWQYEAPYGYVWYPTVASGWRPYYEGYWSPVPTYGWTWIGADVWSWPTHHYGRWGHGGSRWFWIPDRRWSPAWVSWGGAPGYVSWCPLGFNNRPVFALSISSGNSWAGWTVVSRDHFGGRGRHVRQYAVSPRSLPANTPFVTQASAPVAAPRAVPRRAVGGPGQLDQPSSADGRRFSARGRQAPDGSPQPSSSTRQSAVGGRQSSSADQQSPATGRSPQAVSRRPQAGIPQAQPQQEAQPRGRPYDGRDRGAFRSPLPDTGRGRPQPQSDSMIYTNRPGAGRPGISPSAAPSQPSAPATPASPDRQRYGGAIQRSQPSAQPPQTVPTIPTSPDRQRYGGAIRRSPPVAQPPQSAPESSGAGSAPMQRRGPVAAPRYERPQAPPPSAVTAPPPARQERPAAAPPSEGSRQHAGPRGQQPQSSSQSSPPADNQGGQSNRGSRRPR